MHQILLISWFLSLIVNMGSPVNFPSDENIEIKIPVFFDYNNPKKGKSDISVISLMQFDAEKETIVVVTDVFSDYAEKTSYFDSYSENFNFLIVKNRGAHKSFEEKARGEAERDLCSAYTLFSAFQYVNDIESIRKSLLNDKKVYLFAAGSAASLVHQYVTLFGDHVGKFVTLDPIIVDLNSAIGYYKSFESFNELFKQLPQNNISYQSTPSQISDHNDNTFSNNYQNDVEDFDNLSLKIRFYELVFPYIRDVGLDESVGKFAFDVSTLITKVDCPHFTFSGTNYDKLLQYIGKGVIVSSIESATADHRVSQILAEYYQNCSLLLLNDVSTISLLKNSNDLANYLHAFFAGDIDAMVFLYDKLLEAKIIYTDYGG
ncbi:hypothetical protein [Lunatibacter salilacus]|uniref:hypothetical protein n=1 Tax=Lunatibacter salilacus TaxID=2483804 RepID=UPI00131CF826|nr:hypothetical protein [Lunatibacter salilacus]